MKDCDKNSVYVGVPAKKVVMKTLIIAEAGVNHNGDLAIAKRFIT